MNGLVLHTVYFSLATVFSLGTFIAFIYSFSVFAKFDHPGRVAGISLQKLLAGLMMIALCMFLSTTITYFIPVEITPLLVVRSVVVRLPEAIASAIIFIVMLRVDRWMREHDQDDIKKKIENTKARMEDV